MLSVYDAIEQLDAKRVTLTNELAGVVQALTALRNLDGAEAVSRRRTPATSTRRSPRPTRAPKGNVEQAFLAALAGGPIASGDLRSKVRSKIEIDDQQFRYQCAKLVRLGRMKGTGATSGRRYSLP